MKSATMEHIEWRELVNRWATEIVVGAIGVLSFLLHKMVNKAKSQNTIQLTYNQLNTILSERSQEVALLKAELAQRHDEWQKAVIRSAEMNAEITLLNGQIKLLMKQFGVTPDNVKEDVFELCSKGKVKQALELLSRFAQDKDEDMIIELVQIQSQHSNLEDKLKSNTISLDDATRLRNKISESVLQFTIDWIH